MNMARRGHILRVVAPLACLGRARALGRRCSGALIKVGDLVLKADGGFKPQRLPRHSYAPIEFQGHADIHSTDGGPPPELIEAISTSTATGGCRPAGCRSATPDRIAARDHPVARHSCEDRDRRHRRGRDQLCSSTAARSPPTLR